MTPSEQAGSLVIEYVQANKLQPNPRNARKHSEEQLIRLQAVIRNFGFSNPVLIDECDVVIAGHGRLLAATMLGMTEVPCIRLRHLNAAQKQALAIADNKLGELSSWDAQLLSQHLTELSDLDFEVELTGFSTAEIDVLLEPDSADDQPDPDDAVPPIDPSAPAVTRLGDKWLLGKHRLLCADALLAESYEALLGEEKADLVFSDPPYGCAINGHVSGLGKVKHREFCMGGKMSSPDFTLFLTSALSNMARFTVDGSIHFLCIDWRRLPEILEAGSATYTELKNVCVWDKGSGSMGSLYRSQHELVLVFKNGTAPHVNNVQLGRFGRSRTNIWRHPGLNSFGPNRDEQLAMHPTCKPAQLIADAIRDCSKRGSLVLDAFGGVATTLIAAERTGRRAAVMELDPLYVDTAIRRWLKIKGTTATLASNGRSFAEVADARTDERLEQLPGETADHG